MVAGSIRSEELTFVREGAGIRGFAAWPARGERLPALVIVPDVHGLSDHYRDVARRYAAAGFFSFALDIYSREGRPQLADFAAVMAWIDHLDDRRVLGDIDGAVRFLRSRMEVRGLSIGVTGFCLGGQYALMAACKVPGLAACASFYGMLRYKEYTPKKPESPLDLVPNLQCPYFGLFGSDDPLIPRDDVRELEALLRQHKKTFQVRSYPNAGHAFFNDQRPDAYRPEAAQDAWARVISFFQATLSAQPPRSDPWGS